LLILPCLMGSLGAGNGAFLAVSGGPLGLVWRELGRHSPFPCAARSLRRAQSVEAGGVIRPLGVAKVGPSISQGVGAQRRPGRADQVRTGFHHDGDVSRPRNNESERVGLHAKAGTAV